jgi:hypothetical protein
VNNNDVSDWSIFFRNVVSDWTVILCFDWSVVYELEISDWLFNEGVINMGRVLVLFAFTSQMGQQYPTDAWKFWDIYHAAIVLNLTWPLCCPCGAHSLYFNVLSLWGSYSVL